MEYDLHSKVKAVDCIGPAVLAADTNGAAIDMQQDQGYESIEYLIHVGTALAGGGWDVTIEQSPDDGSGSPTGVWTAVPADETLGALPVFVATDTDLVLRVGSIGKERHQRVVLTETGTISAGVTGASAILSHAKQLPVADQST